MTTLHLAGFEIPDHAIRSKFHLSTGAGGQNVNKVSTAVELRFNIEKANLPTRVSGRLRVIAKSRTNGKGEIVIKANNHRSQQRNRTEALARLSKLLVLANMKPRKRIATRPTRASKKARLDKKRKLSEKKRNRNEFLTESD